MGNKRVSNCIQMYLRNGFAFWNVHGIMNTSGILQREARNAYVVRLYEGYQMPYDGLNFVRATKIF